MVKISAAQSRVFVQRVGVPNTPASPSIKRLFDPDPIEDVFWTEEYGDFSPLPTAECPRSHGPRRILPAAEYVLNMAIINYISRIMVINRTVKSLGLVRIIDRALRSRKPVRTTPEGARYHLDSLATMVAASEVFHGEAYRKPLSILRPTRVIDVGANVGLFTLLMASHVRSGPPHALLIEPNPETIELLERNLVLNDLSDLKIVRGAVGSRLSGEAEFHVNSSHIASSLSGRFHPRAGRPRPQTIEQRELRRCPKRVA